ncbi:hypothetical protein HK103_001938 [Boothiomyces macroporosus]|uniref:Uncharacterized protein n=1 Tax=Boothiomyces macroporosus TaxID=261099 RepID=A0AAD5UJE2_9FUNG|nr:hypothetical protein HK103_001938 [Boothiomyces macroporosus]
MSTAKGKAGQKKQGQKHKNSFAFVPNKFSPVAMKIAATPIQGVCQRCKDIIEWKQRMGKYKPLTQPKTCLSCQQKRIYCAYHVLCQPCSTEKQKCAKCHEGDIAVHMDKKKEEIVKEEQELEYKISLLNERQKRSYRRKIERGDDDGANKILGNASAEYSDDDFFDDEPENEDDDVEE